MAEDFELVLLDQWQNAQAARQSGELAALLQEGRLYAIDGGVFQATQGEDGRWTLWAWQGQNGHEVTRTGFEIDGAGKLYDRLYDYLSEEALVLTPAYGSVAELELVTQEFVESMVDEQGREVEKGRD